LAVTVNGDTPTLSSNAFLYRCTLARETRSHRETTVVVPRDCPHLRETFTKAGADMSKLQVSLSLASPL
jgi:hypothetical protein